MLLSSQPPQMTANEKSGQLKSATTKRKKDDIGRIRTCAYKDDGLNVAP